MIISFRQAPVRCRVFDGRTGEPIRQLLYLDTDQGFAYARVYPDPDPQARQAEGDLYERHECPIRVEFESQLFADLAALYDREHQASHRAPAFLRLDSFRMVTPWTEVVPKSDLASEGRWTGSVPEQGVDSRLQGARY